MSHTEQVVEVVPVAPEWAFARTSSAGKQTIHAIKKTTDEANQATHANLTCKLAVCIVSRDIVMSHKRSRLRMFLKVLDSRGC